MVSSDFANIGASRKWRMYVHTVPFMNAAIQGFDQLYQICRLEYRDNLKKPRWGTDRRQHVGKTLRAGAFLAVMASGVWLWNTDNSTRLDQYLEETDYEKASYLTLYDVHGDTDIRIPVPFQIGAAFMKVPEIVIDLSTGTETLAGPRFLWSLVHGNLAISWLPSVVQPFWEVMTNTNFFGSPIIPGYMENWPPVRQFFSRSTPRPMILMGRLRKLNKQIDMLREHKGISKVRKEGEIIATYQERTATYERAVMEMRGPYDRWQREN